MRKFHETFSFDEDGNLLVWGRELVTDADPEELMCMDGGGLLASVSETMAHVEKHDRIVARVLIVEDHLIAETDSPFESWRTGEVRCFQESTPCPDCGARVQWAEPDAGHDADCPYVVVRDVMLR